jgi:hypothetical protein
MKQKEQSKRSGEQAAAQLAADKAAEEKKSISAAKAKKPVKAVKLDVPPVTAETMPNKPYAPPKPEKNESIFGKMGATVKRTKKGK